MNHVYGFEYLPSTRTEVSLLYMPYLWSAVIRSTQCPHGTKVATYFAEVETMYVVCLVWTLFPFLLTLQILTHVGTTASCVERESVLMVLATDIVLLYGLSSFFFTT